MNKSELVERTKKFAIDVIKFVKILPNSQEYWIIGKQLIRCATSVGANYRSALRSQSDKHFISKISIVVEEADECGYWLEIIEGLIEKEETVRGLKNLKSEADQLTAIFYSTKKSVAKRINVT